MFSAYCKQCGTVVLLDPGCVRSIRNTAAGIILDFRCYAGHSGQQLVRRSARHDATVHATAPASSRSTQGAPAARHRSWWSRSRGTRPRQPRHGAAPRPSGLHAT
jgi:hypothetical protein